MGSALFSTHLLTYSKMFKFMVFAFLAIRANAQYGAYAPPSYGYEPVRSAYGAYAPPSYGYGYEPVRSAYGAYAPPSYGYEPVRSAYGAYAPPSYGYGYEAVRIAYGPAYGLWYE